MAKRKTEMGLGRGLNALLGDPDLTAGGPPSGLRLLPDHRRGAPLAGRQAGRSG